MPALRRQGLGTRSSRTLLSYRGSFETLSQNQNTHIHPGGQEEEERKEKLPEANFLILKHIFDMFFRSSPIMK